MSRPKAVMSWSSGKDSAWALHEALQADDLDIVGLLTTVSETHDRVAMHGVRDELLDAQIAALGLPCMKVMLPTPCPNSTYEARMAAATAGLKADGVTHVIFGDLFLEDIRAYRLARMAEAGMTAVFPLWGRETATLAAGMIAGGLVAHVATVDPSRLDASFSGRPFDAAFLADLPPGIDPCGENGEFHTFVSDAPIFCAPIAIRTGETVTRDGFVYTDLLPDSAAH